MNTLRSTALAAALALSFSGAAFAQSEAFDRLPTTEIAGRQIGWFVNRTLDAFVEAVESNKPLIMVFGEAKSSFTQSFAQFVAKCPHLNRLAGMAVFAYGSPVVDEYARRMALHLKLTDYPTISVIAPRTDRLTEQYRMEGFFDGEAVGNDLQKALVANNYARDQVARLRPLPGHYLAYPGLACTREGARHLGVVR